MSMFTVDERCVKCGLCVELCVSKIIRFNEENLPSVPEKMENLCIRCGQCVSFCPQNCCYLDFESEDDRGPLDVSLMPSAEAAEVLLRSRRSVRKYRETPVDEAAVRRIIETARYAPSASNSQPVRWAVTATRARTLEIAGLVVDHFRTQVERDPEAARLSLVVAAWDAGEDIIFRTAPQLAVAIIDRSYFDNYFREDAAMALTYFELAAHANGVGCCWAGFFTLAARASAELARAVGAKENEVVAGGQMFGYPKGLVTPKILPPRKDAQIDWL